MSTFLSSAVSWVESSKYILIFVGCIFEGPVIMVGSGFLYSLGQMDLVPMYFALVLGDFTADIGWYALGRFGTRSAIFKFGKIVNLTPAILEKIESRFKKYQEKILIISKLTMGLGFAAVVLIVAGIFKVPFKNYVILNLVGGFIWTALLVTVGYFFGNIFSGIPESAKYVFIGVALLTVFFGLRFVSNYLSTKEI